MAKLLTVDTKNYNNYNRNEPHKFHLNWHLVRFMNSIRGFKCISNKNLTAIPSKWRTRSKQMKIFRHKWTQHETEMRINYWIYQNKLVKFSLPRWNYVVKLPSRQLLLRWKKKKCAKDKMLSTKSTLLSCLNGQNRKWKICSDHKSNRNDSNW